MKSPARDAKNGWSLADRQSEGRGGAGQQAPRHGEEWQRIV